MTKSRLLPDVLGLEPGKITVALFSQTGCNFCEEVREHYLRPLMASRPPRIAFAEFELDGVRRIQDFNQGRPSEAEFARARSARFAPTVMFFGSRGEVIAAPIVGLSRDFFGAYLDQRIETALKASG